MVKTGIIAVFHPETVDPLFEQQNSGYSPETVLAQK